jgi:hypothetical protein
MGTSTLNDLRDKLQAVLNHHLSGSASNHLPARYVGECKEWFARLSNTERLFFQVAADSFAKGDEAGAERAAAALPAAPKCPL